MIWNMSNEWVSIKGESLVTSLLSLIAKCSHSAALHHISRHVKKLCLRMLGMAPGVFIRVNEGTCKDVVLELPWLVTPESASIARYYPGNQTYYYAHIWPQSHCWLHLFNLPCCSICAESPSGQKRSPSAPGRHQADIPCPLPIHAVCSQPGDTGHPRLPWPRLSQQGLRALESRHLSVQRDLTSKVNNHASLEKDRDMSLILRAKCVCFLPPSPQNLSVLLRWGHVILVKYVKHI